MRYVCLSITLVLRKLSPRAKRKYPSKNSLISAGLLKEDEYKIIMQIRQCFPGNSMYVLPLDWAIAIAEKAIICGRIKHELSYKSILDELHRIHAELELLLKYHLTK